MAAVLAVLVIVFGVGLYRVSSPAPINNKPGVDSAPSGAHMPPAIAHMAPPPQFPNRSGQ